MYGEPFKERQICSTSKDQHQIPDGYMKKPSYNKIIYIINMTWSPIVQLNINYSNSAMY